MCQNSIWDLINSTINRRDERDVQTDFFFFFFYVYETEFVLSVNHDWIFILGWTIPLIIYRNMFTRYLKTFTPFFDIFWR